MAAALACSGAVAPEPRQAASAPPAATSAERRSLESGPGRSVAHPPAVNPFEGARFYVDPEYLRQIRAAAAAAPEHADQLRELAAIATGLWVWSIDDVEKVGPALLDAAEQSARGQPVVPLFVVGDMPGQDCDSGGSDELGADPNGERRYRSEFIDPLAARFAARPEQRAVVILEPFVLGTLATSEKEACVRAAPLIRSAIVYALRKLSRPNVFIYLGAGSMTANCWNQNRPRLAQVYREILVDAGDPSVIRGFATNVGNYNLFEGDADRKISGSNPCANELEYIEKLSRDLAKVGIVDKHFLVDTSRNGRGGIRTNLGNWCNIKGAGLGARPRAAPAPHVDAFVWAKPPGTSDGSSERSAPGFNPGCQSPDSTPGAPTGGAWFQSHFLSLLERANPPL